MLNHLLPVTTHCFVPNFFSLPVDSVLNLNYRSRSVPPRLLDDDLGPLQQTANNSQRSLHLAELRQRDMSDVSRWFSQQRLSFHLRHLDLLRLSLHSDSKLNPSNDATRLHDHLVLYQTWAVRLHSEDDIAKCLCLQHPTAATMSLREESFPPLQWRNMHELVTHESTSNELTRDRAQSLTKSRARALLLWLDSLRAWYPIFAARLAQLQDVLAHLEPSAHRFLMI